MREISAGAALGAGFRLIGREPAAFAAWCGVYFLIGVLPQGLLMGPMIGMMRELGAGAAPTSPAVLAAQDQFLRYQPLSYLTGLLVAATLPSAIFRAVLFPEDRRYLYLRLGMREVWMGVSVVTLVIMMVIGFIAAMIPTFLVVAVAARGGGGGGLAALLVFPFLGVVVWAGLRLSLAPVMSFADRTFRLPEAWRLSRRHAGQMFLVSLALFVLLLVGEGVVVGVGFGLLAATTPDLSRALESGPAGVFTQLQAPQMIVSGLLLAVFGGWLYVMWGAAWASMYRDLTHNEHDVFS